MAKKTTSETHWILIVPMVFLTSILIWISVFAFWLSATLFNQQFFVNTTTKAIKSEEARQVISQMVVSRFLSEYPLIKTLIGNTANKTISDLLNSSQMEFVYQKATEEAFHQMMDENPGEVAISLSKVTSLASIVQLVNPTLGTNLGNLPEKIVLIPKNELLSLYVYRVWAGVLGPASGVFALILLGVMLFLAKGIGDKLKALGTAGIMVGAISALIYFVLPTLPEQVLAQITNPLVLVIASQIIDKFLGSLTPLVFKIMIGGLVVGAFGLSIGFVLRRK